MYTICYIVFFVLSTLAAFKNDTRKLNALYRQPNTVYSAAFITACSHTTKMQKTGYSFCYALFFMAESEGFFGVLPYSFASLRSLTTDFQTVHRTIFIGKAGPVRDYLISSQARYDHFDNSPYSVLLSSTKSLYILPNVHTFVK